MKSFLRKTKVKALYISSILAIVFYALVSFKEEKFATFSDLAGSSLRGIVLFYLMGVFLVYLWFDEGVKLEESPALYLRDKGAIFAGFLCIVVGTVLVFYRGFGIVDW